MPRLVIFDCDGVLVDSERLAIKVDVDVMSRVGWRLTEAEAIEQFVGLSMAQIRAKVEARIGRCLPGTWEEDFNASLRQRYQAELRPVEGIVEALDSIEHGSCVASSGTHDKIRFSLSLTGLYSRFSGRIFSASEVSNGKPAPDLFLHAAKSMGVRPKDCAVVEDSAPGVVAALAAGMTVFAYAGGVTPAAKLCLSDAVVFDDMRLLPNLLAAHI